MIWRAGGFVGPLFFGLGSLGLRPVLVFRCWILEKKEIMKVRMLTSLAGGCNAAPGEVVLMGNDEGQRFVKNGLAELVEPGTEYTKITARGAQLAERKSAVKVEPKPANVTQKNVASKTVKRGKRK